MPETRVAGSCLCGSVRFEVAGNVTPIGCCHCSQCRKTTGGAHHAELMIGREGLRFLAGETHVREFRLPSGWRMAFCTDCGSQMPKLHPEGGAWWVPAGLFAGDPGVRIAGHIFVGSQAPWEDLTGPAPRFDTTPPGRGEDRGSSR
jgi:hypothetical protein